MLFRSLGGKSRRRSKVKEDWVQEADQKGGKEEVDVVFLLLDPQTLTSCRRIYEG